MIKKGLLTGILLFGIFFGAGNLIFPPNLGWTSGTSFWPAILGFCLSGVGLAVVTLLVGTFSHGGYKEELQDKIGPRFALGFLSLLYLTIGPLFAIPRTATVSFEIGVKSWGTSGALALMLFSAVFFWAAYWLAVRPNGMMTSIGKILTPLFVGMILLVILVGFFRYGTRPVAPVSGEYVGSPFGTGFLEGYNTLDALASVAFSLIATNTLRQFGFSSLREYRSTVWVVGVVTTLAFSVLYIGLGFLGNHFPLPSNIVEDPSINLGAYILAQASYQLFGSFGQAFLSLMVIVTCFTTTVGLIVSVSEFFVENFKGLAFKPLAALFSVLGFLIANLGLNTVIAVSVPVLTILYPMVIVLVILVLLQKVIPLSQRGMQAMMGLVTLTTILDVLSKQFDLQTLQGWISALPFSDWSLAWIVPAGVGLLLALLGPGREKGKSFDLAQLMTE